MLTLGTIVGTHHLLGAMKLKSSSKFLESLVGEDLLLEKNGDMKILKLSSCKFMNDKKYIVQFETINNIEKAKELNGYILKARKDLIPDFNVDELYVEDLISYTVVDSKTKEKMGDVIDVFETSAHPILTMIYNEKEVMIPYVEDVFIVSIDVDKKEIVVNFIEGLI